MNNLLGEADIKSKIYVIRGKQVMLDSDLAKLYKCKNGTKDINKAVNRNINRFPSDFYFELISEECLRFQSGTLKKGRGEHNKYLPHVFTEQGVAMLSSVLHTTPAEEISIQIMRAFVEMRHYLNDSEFRLNNVEEKIIEHDLEIKTLKELFDNFDTTFENEIYYNGQMFDAYYKIYEIFNKAKEQLIIIDNYADNIVLDIIKRLSIDVIIITKDNKILTNQDIEKYNSQYNNLKVIYNNTFHDRYFILDKKYVYHCGTSINRIGYKTFSINFMSDIEIYNNFIKVVNSIIDN